MFRDWLDMNLKYEKSLLMRLEKRFGTKSKKYKRKLEQIENLQNGR